MGADIRIKINQDIDTYKLLEDCKTIPIDCEVYMKDGKRYVHFHYAYWSTSHCQNCERFVKEFVLQNNLKMEKWRY